MSEATYTSLRTERHGAVLHVVLTRPEIHDAFDEHSIRDLTVAFEAAAHDDAVRVVLLRSTGKHFSAGADVSWLRRVGAYEDTQNLADAVALHGMLAAIATCPKPVVARIQGAALGGGGGLAAAVDIAIASERALFGFTEVRLGIAPATISPFVLRKVHAGRALGLFLTGERFGAREALACGLVHKVVPEDELDAAVEATIAALLEGSPVGQARIKQLVEQVRGRDLTAAGELTTRAIADLRAGPEGQEGLAAFLDKRKPRWAAD